MRRLESMIGASVMSRLGARHIAGVVTSLVDGRYITGGQHKSWDFSASETARLALEATTSRRRIRPMCREVLAAKCHGGKDYTGAWTMREEMYTKIVAMAVARHEGVVVGWSWVASRCNPSSTGFLGTWVNEEWRLQGLGREMAEAVFALYPKDVTAEAIYPEGVAFYKAVFPDPPSQTRRHSGYCFHFLK